MPSPSGGPGASGQHGPVGSRPPPASWTRPAPRAVGGGDEQEVGGHAGAVLVGQRLDGGVVAGDARIREMRAEDRQLGDQAALAGGELAAPLEQPVERLLWPRPDPRALRSTAPAVMTRLAATSIATTAAPVTSVTKSSSRVSSRACQGAVSGVGPRAGADQRRREKVSATSSAVSAPSSSWAARAAR